MTNFRLVHNLQLFANLSIVLANVYFSQNHKTQELDKILTFVTDRRNLLGTGSLPMTIAC